MESVSIYGRFATDAVERTDTKGRTFLYFTFVTENTSKDGTKETLYRCAYTGGTLQPWMRKGARAMVSGRLIVEMTETETNVTFDLKVYSNLIAPVDRAPRMHTPAGLGGEAPKIPEGFADPFSSLDPGRGDPDR